MGDLDESSRQTVNPPSESGHGEKKHQLSDVDSPTNPLQDARLSKRRFSKRQGSLDHNRDQTVSSEVSNSDIDTPSKRSPLSTSRQNPRGLRRTSNKYDNTNVLRT